MRLIEKLIVLCIFALILIIKLDSITKVWVDEPWYANTAFNFSQNNRLENTNVGMRGGDDTFFYTLLLGLFYKVFPVQLYFGRLFSVILGLIFFLIFLEFILKNLNNDFLKWLSILYVSTNISFIVIFRTIRPESLGILLTMVCIYLLYQPVNLKNTIFLSSVSFLSFLTHPSFAFLFVAIFLIYVYHNLIINNKNKIFILYFIIIFIFWIIIYFAIIIFYKKETLKIFFSDWFPRVNDKKSLTFELIYNKIKDFIKDYSLGVKRIYIFFYEIISMIIGFIYFKKNKNFQILLIISVVFLFFNIFILKQISLRFFSTISLFSFLIFLESIKNSLQEKKPVKNYFFLILTLIYIVNNIGGMIFLYLKDKNNTPYSFIENRISSIVPDNTVTLSLLNLWFPLKNTDNINEYTLPEKKGANTFKDILEKNKPEYVVITEYLTQSESTTSGRYLGNSKKQFFTDYINLVKDYVKNGFFLLDTIETRGYGTIKIYKFSSSLP